MTLREVEDASKTRARGLSPFASEGSATRDHEPRRKRATWAVSPEPFVRGRPRHVFAACAAAHACYRRSAKTHRSRELPLVRSHPLRSTSTEKRTRIGQTPPRHSNIRFPASAVTRKSVFTGHERLRFTKAARKQHEPLARIQVALLPQALLFVKPAKRAYFVSAARGGDASRGAMRRTGRDDVSSPDAAQRIIVAKQPASTPPAFVLARSAAPSDGERPGGSVPFRVISAHRNTHSAVWTN